MADQALFFRVRSSSSDEVYDVEAIFVPRLRITCSCQAGLLGSICRHRTALLLGDVTSVVEIAAEDVESLSLRAAASPLGAAMSALTELERDAERLKREIAGRKKQIARIMNGQ